jgi:hypothetical protein
VKAGEAFRDTFGKEVRELNAGAIRAEIRNEIARYEDVVVSTYGLLTLHRLPGGGLLDGALGQMKAIVRGTEENAILTFNASHRSIKDAIKRAVELEQALSEPRLRDIERARQALNIAWPFLDKEPDLSEDIRSHATELQDLFSRETFFRELPAIEQHAGAIESEYVRRFEDALQARIDAYTKAFDQLTKTPGWSSLQEDVQRSIAAPLQSGMARVPATVPIALLRSERDACEGRLRTAVRAVQEVIEGERLAPVYVEAYFKGGIETEEQLEAALAGLRHECLRLIGAGKKVILS